MHLESSSPPVKIYAIGRFSVLVSGHELSFARKAPKRPLELLKAIIAFGSRGVREEALADTLWPDSEADAAAGSLTSTIHRLRKLIGDRALVRQNGQLSLDPSHCWVDLWTIEKGLNGLAAYFEQAATGDGVRETQQLLALNRGVFLADESEQHWVLTKRDHLQSCFTRLFEGFGLRHARTGRYQLARDCFEAAIEVAPENERPYRELMRVHLAQQERSQVLAVYVRCERVLAAKYGCRPSSETEALVRQCVAAG